jgi:Invasin, domain 3
MRLPSARTRLADSGVRALAVMLLLGFAGCGLDKQPTPALAGPSDAGVSVQLTASPDVVNADGVSQSVVRLVLRDENGHPLSGRAVLFQHNGDGYMAPSTASSFVGPVQTGLVMATDRDGVAYVVYVAGTDLRSVVIFVRPYGIDTAYTWERTLEIIQQ